MDPARNATTQGWWHDALPFQQGMPSVGAPQKMQEMQKIENPAENGHRMDVNGDGQKMQKMPGSPMDGAQDASPKPLKPPKPRKPR